jgi:lantibiotic modifying enzyme
LGTVEFNAGQPFQNGQKTLQKIIQIATEFQPRLETILPTDSEDPIPFEDIFLPIITVARLELLNRVEEHLPQLLLTEAAYRNLERSLLRRLGGFCTKTLHFEFSQVRPFGQNLLNLLGLETETNKTKTHYNKFINQLLQDGLMAFFSKYPVLVD